ncbi:MAG: hypothetical protein QOC92_3706 [Acidimicrobiaceae bacterium]
MADPDFARRVYEAPEGSTAIEYNLDPAEWQAVQRALAADVESATDEVSGFADPFSLDISFVNVGALSPRDPASGLPTGKRKLGDIKIVKTSDSSTATLL